jgi:hypothetical protein
MLLSHYKWAVLAAVIPRLCLSGFTFAQPFLFERVVGFISEPKANYTDNHGYGLILAAVIIYFGIAVSFILQLTMPQLANKVDYYYEQSA